MHLTKSASPISANSLVFRDDLKNRKQLDGRFRQAVFLKANDSVAANF